MSLWSLSVPDGSVEQPLGKGTDLMIFFTGQKARIWNARDGKYRSHTTNTAVVYPLRLKETFETHPKTGVEL